MAVRIAVAVGMFLGAWPSVALAERPFAPRFSQNAQGDIALVANTLLSCVATEPACPAARAGTSSPISAANNNARVMTYVDVDADPATFSSSGARLTLPADGRVLFAGLYWGGRLAGGAGGAPAPNPAASDTVLLRAPGDADYRTVRATQPVDTAGETYQHFLDVTDIVRAAGTGEYVVANVQAGTGRSDGQLAGWTLVVAYGDGASPPRNLSVFDGLQQVGSNSPGVTIPLTGFRTPSSGAVRSKVGVVAYEGDRGTTGDGLTLQGAAGPVTLTNAVNPATNAFNSTISVDGADTGTRNPAYTNQLGFDADVFTATNVLGNGQTSTQVRLTTNGDAYQPGVATIATELFAPRIEATKAVSLNTAALGQELTYTTTIRNTGQDAATLVDFDDALPAGVTPLPNTLTVDGAPVPDPTGGPLRLADLPPGTQRVVAFRVQIDDRRDRHEQRAGERRLRRVHRRRPRDAQHRAHAPGLQRGSSCPTSPSPSATRPTSSSARRPRTRSRSATGAVRRPSARSASPTRCQRVSRPVPSPRPGWTCTAPPALVCTRTDPLAPGADYPPIEIVVTPQLGSGAISNTATVSAAPDGDASNDSYTDAGAATLAVVDLELAKVTISRPSLSPNGFAPGERIEFELTVRNNGPDTAREVGIADLAPTSLVVDRTATDAPYPCTYPDAPVPGTYLECQVGTLAPGQSRSIRVVATWPRRCPRTRRTPRSSTAARPAHSRARRTSPTTSPSRPSRRSRSPTSP